MRSLLKLPEDWRDISGSLDYQISDLGNVRKKLKNGKLKSITPYCVKGKWMMVKVRVKNKYSAHYIHKLVAESFLESPKNPEMVLYHKTKR